MPAPLSQPVRRVLHLAAPLQLGPADRVRVLRLLALLLIGDTVFVVLAVALKLGWLTDENFSLSQDRGYPEIFQYVKFVGIVLCFALLTGRARQPLFAVVAVLFTYLLLDDALTLHEMGGEMLAAQLDFSAGLGLRARDFGEMLVSAGVAGLLLGAGWWTYRSSTPAARRVTQLVLAGVVLLAFFGVAVDMVGMTMKISGVNFALSVIEDGGEMAAVSLIAAIAFAAVHGYRRVSPATAPPAP